MQQGGWRVGTSGPALCPVDAHREARLAAVRPVGVWQGDLAHQGPAPPSAAPGHGDGPEAAADIPLSSIHTGRSRERETTLR